MNDMLRRVKEAIRSSARECGVSFSGTEYVARAAIAAMREPMKVGKVLPSHSAPPVKYEMHPPINNEWGRKVIEEARALCLLNCRAVFCVEARRCRDIWPGPGGTLPRFFSEAEARLRAREKLGLQHPDVVG